jgi:NAD(P)H-dependent flavin oxidoreductase YrpB (nitropropane dioxygenase family)
MYSFLNDLILILGGMGVHISSPPLVNAFSKACEKLDINGLGTVSGTAVERLMVTILQSGDQGGHFRRALSHFPMKGVADRVLNAYYDPSGRGLKSAPVYRLNPSRNWIELAVTANFAFVWLAKEGHNRPVSINYLEKIALPFVYYVTGAVMAGVDVITMGAGLPFDIPQVIDNLMNGRTLRYPIPIIGVDGHLEKEKVYTEFNPWEFFGGGMPALKRPAFIPIISSILLAKLCVDPRRMPTGSVQGFVVEESTAGGHNAPPRGSQILDEHGQPVYGEKDKVDYGKLREIGLPFWIGGSCSSPEKLNWALSMGATGIQAGSIFAYSKESGMNPLIREDFIRRVLKKELRIFTSPRFSPTGFPFKVAVLPDTLADPETYNRQVRACTQGALVSLYRKPDGSIGYRCPSEPVDTYIRKGGKIEDTFERRCLCSGLMATAGLGKLKFDHTKIQAPIVTSGDDLDFIHHLGRNENGVYSVEDAIRHLMGI